MGPSPNPYCHGASLALETFASMDIVRVSNWGYWYEAKGRRLSDMELDNAVFVFPDGSGGGGRLEVGSRLVSDGHEGPIHEEILYLVVERGGLEFKRPWKPGDATTFTWAECKRP